MPQCGGQPRVGGAVPRVRRVGHPGRGGRPAPADGEQRQGGGPSEPATPIVDVPSDAGLARPTGIAELDRVLGGGLVPGSVTLLGGEPGIGKSTLLLQVAAAVAGRAARVLYVSAEESRPPGAARGPSGSARSPDGVWLAAETAAAPRARPRSTQVEPERAGRRLDPDRPRSRARRRAPGSVAQVRECAAPPRRRGQGARHRRRARRPRHQGRRPRRAPGARARRRHRAVLRGRPPPRAPAAPRGQAPLRRHRRARPLRDDRRRPGRRARRRRPVPRRPPAGRARARSSCPRSRAPARCWSRSRRSSPARAAACPAGRPRASTPAASPCCSPCSSSAARDPRCGRTTSSPSAAGGVRVHEPGADLASPSPWPRRITSRPCPTTWSSCGEVGLGGELRQVSQLDAAAGRGRPPRVPPRPRAARRRPTGRAGIELAPGRARVAEAIGRAGLGDATPVPRQPYDAPSPDAMRSRSRPPEVARRRCSTPSPWRPAQRRAAGRARRWSRPGTPLREGLDRILQAGMGALDRRRRRARGAQHLLGRLPARRRLQPAAAVRAGQDGRRHHPGRRRQPHRPRQRAPGAQPQRARRRRPAPGTAPPSGWPARSTCR